MRILVVGAGYWGPNVVRNLVEFPDVEEIGIADLDIAKARSVAFRFPRTVLARPAPEAFQDGYDAVVIVTPVQTHAALASAALRSGLHVLVEKPITRTSHEAEELIRIADEKDVRLMAGHVFHYKPAVRALTKMAREGVLGSLRYMDSVRVNLGLFRPDVNVLWDLAPHDLTIFESVMRRMPERVSAIGASHVAHPSVRQETMAYMTLDYGGDVLGHIHANWFSPLKQRQMVVVGDQKMIVYDDIEYSEPLKVYDSGTYRPEADTSSYPAIRTGDVHIPYFRQEEPLRLQLREFLDAIRDHRSPETDGRAGLRVVKILEAASASLVQNGQFVSVTQ